MTVEQELSLTGTKKQTENWYQSHACFAAAATVAMVPDASNEAASIYINGDKEIGPVSNPIFISLCSDKLDFDVTF